MKTTSTFAAQVIGKTFSYVCEYTGETITEEITNMTGPYSSDMVQCKSFAVYERSFVKKHLAITE